MTKRLRIGIALPLYKNVEAHFFNNFIDVLKEVMPKSEVSVLTHVGTTIDHSRNELVKKAQLDKCDYVWFIDTDQLISKGTLDKLLALKVNIASALYFTRTPPIIPVMRKFENGCYEGIFDWKDGEVLEVDGIGLGCCLIKMNVFDDIEFPYFKLTYENFKGYTLHVSEDLNFCRKVRKAGFKIYVDTGLIARHIGGIVDGSEYNKKFYVQSKWFKDMLMEDLAEFDKISVAQAKANMLQGVVKFKEEWNKKKPKSSSEIKRFYKTSYWNKYDAAHWHLTNRYQFDRQLIQHIKSKYGMDCSILDYGCGNGDNSYLLAQQGYWNITLYDLNSKFAEFRFNKHKLMYNTTFKEKYDVIFCFDVLEHLDEQEFKTVTKFLKNHIKPNGEILITAPFGDNGLHPMHFNATPSKIKTIKSLMKNARIS